MMANTIAVSEIRQWMNTICDAFEARGLSAIPLDQECYWEVFFDEAYEFPDPPEAVVASLSDDINDLRKEMQAFRSEDIGMIIGHACQHLQGIVKYMAFMSSGLVANASEKIQGEPHA